jgi:hypothetical protein
MKQGEAEPEGDWPHTHDDIQIGTPVWTDTLKAPRQAPFPTTHSDGDRGCAAGGVPRTGADKHRRNLCQKHMSEIINAYSARLDGSKSMNRCTV